MSSLVAQGQLHGQLHGQLFALGLALAPFRQALRRRQQSCLSRMPGGLNQNPEQPSSFSSAVIASADTHPPLLRGV